MTQSIPQTLPTLPEPDGYAAISGGGTIIVPPRDFAKHNAYAVFTADQMREYALAALSQPMGVAGIPEGWKLVPIEPTEAMCEMALWAALNDETGREIVMKAIEAAPQPPAGQQDSCDTAAQGAKE